MDFDLSCRRVSLSHLPTVTLASQNNFAQFAGHHQLAVAGLLRVDRTITTMVPDQNGRHFADDIFESILLNEHLSIQIKFQLEFASNGSFDDKSALVQAMAWHRTGDKPLSKFMITQSPGAYMYMRDQATVSLTTDSCHKNNKLATKWAKVKFTCHNITRAVVLVL